MKKDTNYDTIVLVTPADFNRLKSQHSRMIELLPSRRVLFIGSEEVGDLLNREINEGVLSDKAAVRTGFINENNVIDFCRVQEIMDEIAGSSYADGHVPRRCTGWYYQQFVKYAYADICEDEYYMSWDGDTIPCKTFSMFSDSGTPYLDYKREHHEEYFTTMKAALGLFKVIEPSFISEHMLFKKNIVHGLTRSIEENESLTGSVWWEKLLHAVRPEMILENSFSEFETYGTFAALKFPGEYRLREWHSFRLAGQFFFIDTISDRDYEWLSHDFTAVSFEKNMTVRDDIKNLFDNPRYQSALSARQMLEVAQEEFKEGDYIEKWDIPLTRPVETYETDKTRPDRLRYLSDEEWRVYERLGDALIQKNPNQANLCYENAAFLCLDDVERVRIEQKRNKITGSNKITVKKVCILILSYNQKYFMEKCLESIIVNCDPKTCSIVILDNASTDGVREWLISFMEKDEADDHILILSEKNLGFSGGCNTAVAYTPEDQDILLLNNDTRMTPNALFWLRMGLYEDHDIGAVGAMQNYGTKDQLVNITLDTPEDYVEYGALNNIPMRDKYWEEMPKLSGFALLIKAGLYQELGGLDERFSPGYLEDVDLCFRIRKAGYRLILCRNSFIYHAGSQSFAKRKDMQEIFDRSFRLFLEKWQDDEIINDLIESQQDV